MRLIDANKLIEAFKAYPFGDSMTPQAAIDVIDGFADANREHEMYEKKKIKTFLTVRDILRKSGNSLAYNTCYSTPWGFYGRHSVDECVKILLDQCTVTDKNCSTKTEAESVKHGKWLDTRNISYSTRCSECGRYATGITPYCPNCGVKMDGGNEIG